MNLDQIIARFAGRARAAALDPPGTPPRGDRDLNPDMGSRPDLRPAAVLIALVDRPDGPRVLLTRRTEHLAHHAGQISFPGGVLEEADGPPERGGAENAALRETAEEIGLARSHIRLIGRLDDYETRTGFRVSPVVGIVTPPFDLDPDPFEVADVFEVPLDFLLDPANHQRHDRTIEGVSRQFFAIPYGERFIWGATAGMLMNLYDFLRQ